MNCVVCNKNQAMDGSSSCSNDECTYLNRMYNNCTVCGIFGYMQIKSYDHGYFCNESCAERYWKKNRFKYEDEGPYKCPKTV